MEMKSSAAFDVDIAALVSYLIDRYAICSRHYFENFQEERLRRLKHRMKVYFDASRPDHQEALRALWAATYPDQELHGLISDQWKEMGWQGKDPSTDFRGAGFISLENLLFFAKTFSTSFQRLLRKQGGKRAAWEYPFAVAGVNITFMLMQMLDLEATKPRTFVRSVFLQMLSALVILKRVVSDNEWAFDLLYCVAFVVMDKQWLERNATYMEFNDVLKSTRAQLERELLMDDVLQIEEMPSYSLLTNAGSWREKESKTEWWECRPTIMMPTNESQLGKLKFAKAAGLKSAHLSLPVGHANLLCIVPILSDVSGETIGHAALVDIKTRKEG
ncbi:ELMO domain-containing protein [Citrus sinensis]|nr:ELMO domain-containing protein [Citrus sinensis]